MKDNIGPPPSHYVPMEYQPEFFQGFEDSLLSFFAELLSPGHVEISTMRALDLPVAGASMTDKTVYSDNGYLRLAGSGTASDKSGTATIADTASTVSVSFGTAFPDANYAVGLSADGNELVWVTGKSASGFTINRAGTTGARVVDWVALPHRS